MQTFIQQANAYGKAGCACFFYVDFEQQKPVICRLEECAKRGIYFAFPAKKNAPPPSSTSAIPQITLTRPLAFADYEKAFSKVQKAFAHGDSYLLNLTFPSEIDLKGDLASLFHYCYAPFKLYVENQFVCFSPESFVSTHERKIYTYPMKGTALTDTLHKKEAQATLLASLKEQQEHYCIVDLMRNDLAMVSENIHVKRFRFIDEIPTPQGILLQTSSEICGDLRANWQENLGEMLARLLPAGSVSGTPKQKACEIIRSVEKSKRGYYTGIFGYFDGENLHSAVAIRFIEKTPQGYVFKSGGGITRHSQGEKEYAELLHKVTLPVKSKEQS